ncbi:MAG: hypothetical protein QM831_35225 [Kofleriaceae bacterium]
MLTLLVTAAAAVCSYTEQYDTTNDYLASTNYQLEESGLGFGTICGIVNAGHFDTDYFSDDIDNYSLDVAADSDVIVTLTGDLASIAQVGVWIYDPVAGTSQGSYYDGDHAVVTTHLAAGHYELSVEAYDDVASTEDIPYVVDIEPDDPNARCAMPAGNANYTEFWDQFWGSRLNDVILTNFDQFPARSLTPFKYDFAEPIWTTVATTPVKINGTAGRHAQDDSYFDRDTYQFTTGATTNQLSVRVEGGADFDAYLFAANSVFPLGSAATTRNGDVSVATFAVQPNTTYWVWVGNYKTTTAAAPINYSLALCPASM